MALLELTEEATGCLDKYHVVGVFIDFFDTINFDKLLKDF